MFFDIHHLPCLITLAPYSPPSPGRAEQSEGREEAGGGREGSRGSPLLTPAPWNLYIVLLFGFFIRDKMFPSHRIISQEFCSVPAIPSCYLLHCSTENPGVLSIFLLRCALDPILGNNLGVPFTDSYHMVWRRISMVLGEVHERDN